MKKCCHTSDAISFSQCLDLGVQLTIDSINGLLNIHVINQNIQEVNKSTEQNNFFPIHVFL
jgi:hypothetical protein